MIAGSHSRSAGIQPHLARCRPSTKSSSYRRDRRGGGRRRCVDRPQQQIGPFTANMPGAGGEYCRSSHRPRYWDFGIWRSGGRLVINSRTSRAQPHRRRRRRRRRRAWGTPVPSAPDCDRLRQTWQPGESSKYRVPPETHSRRTASTATSRMTVGRRSSRLRRCREQLSSSASTARSSQRGWPISR